MKLLIADDELLTREGLASSIDWESMGIHQIFQADDGLRALHIAKLQEPDIILSDIRMPRMSGMELLKKISRSWPCCEVIMLTAEGSIAEAVAAMKQGAFSYFVKPADIDEMITDISPAAKRSSASAPLEQVAISKPWSVKILLYTRSSS